MTGELNIQHDGPVLRLTLNRPDKRNALSRSLVTALHDAFRAAGEDAGTRVVVLSGDGPAFCAGGDLAEFVEAAASRRAVDDAAGIVDLLGAMTSCPLPIVARIHGAAYGGGVGLICAADIAIAAERSRFSLSEARLGLIPGVISPWVFAALGSRHARALMLEAAPFGTDVALRCGLVHQVGPVDDLDDTVVRVVGHLLHGAPGALTAIKRLPEGLNAFDPQRHRAATTAMLADRLASDEGQEGMRAFLEKRSPRWAPGESPQ
jgi:methylglutaconyl-CoA hydratase